MWWNPMISAAILLILLAEKIFFEFIIWIKALTYTQMQVAYALRLAHNKGWGNNKGKCLDINYKK